MRIFYSFRSLFRKVGVTHSIFFRVKHSSYLHILHNSEKHVNEHLLCDIEATPLKIYTNFYRLLVRFRELVKYFDFVEQEQKVINSISVGLH